MTETRCDFCHAKITNEPHGTVSIPEALYKALVGGQTAPKKQREPQAESGFMWISFGGSSVPSYEACGECLRKLVLMREHVMDTIAKAEGV